MPDAAPPACECHGLPKIWRNDPRRKRGGFWICRRKGAAAQARYAKTAKGKKAKSKYNTSKKGKAAEARYAATRIRVTVSGVKLQYRVQPERREELVAQVAAHRASQHEERREVARNGWND